MLIILGEFLNFSNNSGLIRYFFVMTNKNQLGLNFFFFLMKFIHSHNWKARGNKTGSYENLTMLWALPFFLGSPSSFSWFQMAASLLGLRTLAWLRGSQNIFLLNHRLADPGPHKDQKRSRVWVYTWTNHGSQSAKPLAEAQIICPVPNQSVSRGGAEGSTKPGLEADPRSL